MSALAALPSRPLPGIACMICGGALLTLNDAILKLLVSAYPAGELLFLRNVFMLAMIVAFAWYRGWLGRLKPRNLRGQMARAAMLIASAYLFVIGLKYLPLADAVAITFTGPLFITALAAPMLGETVGWRRWAAVAVGFLGMVVMLRPTAGVVQWVALWALGASLAGALRDLLTRRLSATETSLSILTVSAVAVLLAGLASAPFGWPVPTWRDLALLALAGAILFAAHFLLIETFRLAEAAVVAPFKYANILFGTLFGYLLFGQLPDEWTVAGATVIAGSGLYILHRETRRARAKAS